MGQGIAVESLLIAAELAYTVMRPLGGTGGGDHIDPFAVFVRCFVHGFGLPGSADRAGMKTGAGRSAGRLFGDGPLVPAVRKLRDGPDLLCKADRTEANLFSGCGAGGGFDRIPLAPAMAAWGAGCSVCEDRCRLNEDHSQQKEPGDCFSECHVIPSLIVQ